MGYLTGRLWNRISKKSASKVSRQMYYGNSFVESDLCNSYAWDTTLLYIQLMGNLNYANQGKGANTSLKNTGKTGDEKCKVFDMAGNLREWTTEYSTETSEGPGGTWYVSSVFRGGSYWSGTASTRACSFDFGDNDEDLTGLGFRVLLYIKSVALDG